MKQTINSYGFKLAFELAGRRNQFSHEALDMLFDHFEEIENDTGDEVEMDVLAICCDYAELSEEEIRSDYDIDSTDDDAVLEYLENHTQVVGITRAKKIVFSTCF